MHAEPAPLGLVFARLYDAAPAASKHVAGSVYCALCRTGEIEAAEPVLRGLLFHDCLEEHCSCLLSGTNHLSELPVTTEMSRKNALQLCAWSISLYRSTSFQRFPGDHAGCLARFRRLRTVPRPSNGDRRPAGPFDARDLTWCVPAMTAISASAVSTHRSHPSASRAQCTRSAGSVATSAPRRHSAACFRNWSTGTIGETPLKANPAQSNSFLKEPIRGCAIAHG